MRRKTSVDVPDRRFGIGVLSDHSGCKVETIRYYERIGLLPEPPRSSGGHRTYSGRHLHRLRFIRRSRTLGFTLDRIRELLGLVDGGELKCKQVRRIAGSHLEEVRAKLSDLRQMEAVLNELVDGCHGGETSDCPIIENLFQGR